MCRNTVCVRVVILAFKSQGRNYFAEDFIIKSNDDQTLKYRSPRRPLDGQNVLILQPYKSKSALLCVQKSVDLWLRQIVDIEWSKMQFKNTKCQFRWYGTQVDHFSSGLHCIDDVPIFIILAWLAAFMFAKNAFSSGAPVAKLMWPDFSASTAWEGTTTIEFCRSR